MTELKKILSIYLDLYLHQIIISGARTKEGASKIRIRPVVMKDKLYFQCTSTVISDFLQMGNTTGFSWITDSGMNSMSCL